MIHNIDTYMKMAESPKVIVYGLKRNYILDMVSISRPTPHKVRDICRNGVIGVVEFEDTFSFEIQEVDDIYKAELYYNNELVSMRVFPPINMFTNDTLTLIFKLQIYRTINEVWF